MMKKILIGAVILVTLIFGAWLWVYETKPVGEMASIGEIKAGQSDNQKLAAAEIKAANSEVLQEAGDGGRPSFVPAFQNRQEFEEQMKKSGAKYLAPGKGSQTINITLNAKGGK